MKLSRAAPLLVVCFVILSAGTLLANGGAWQTGVPLTGNGAPSDKNHSTEVAIEAENLTIDLHQEFAAVEVRYRMHNTGAKVLQDFFFPVERWTPEEGEHDTPAEGEKPADLEGYRIAADKTDLTVKTISLPAPKRIEHAPETDSQTTSAAETDSTASGDGKTAQPNKQSEDQADEHSGEEPEPDLATLMAEFPPATKSWKKSEIPFGANQTREIVIRYRVRYRGYERSVSDDSSASEKLLVYSLSPAATWKGAIGRGKITVNVLHPVPEEVRIERPKERFNKISDTRYEWEFTDLEPTLADDLTIVAHRASRSYYAAYDFNGEGDPPSRDYVVEGDKYFILHADFSAVATSTLRPAGERQYGVNNIKSYATELPWCEGAEGDGIGESIALEVEHPLPLDSITIMPGYHSLENPSLWSKNNRVAELEVTLNGSKTFALKIPDEEFTEPYPIPIRDYDEPVKSVKLAIKAVHRGTAARDTCISDVRLKGKLAQKPTIHPAR